jgi:hypothetical protein
LSRVDRVGQWGAANVPRLLELCLASLLLRNCFKVAFCSCGIVLQPRFLGCGIVVRFPLVAWKSPSRRSGFPRTASQSGGAANVPRFLVFLPAIYDLILKNIVDENKTTATEFKI